MAISINGTTGISGVDGSAGTPALQGTDTNTGMAFGSDVIIGSTGGSERFRCDSSGRMLVGTSTARTNVVGTTPAIQLEGANDYGKRSMSIVYGQNDSASPIFFFAKHRSTSVGGQTAVQSGDVCGQVMFSGSDGTNFVRLGEISAEVDGTPGANDMPGRLVFSTTADGASSPTERMRIQSTGRVNFGSNLGSADVISNNVAGIILNGSSDNRAEFSRDGGAGVLVNRKTDDGALIIFYQDGTLEGTISVSGTTVSYNGAHLSRYSQLPSGTAREEILRGTVLSNIDEMCEWGDEENEQLNRMKVSDVEGDKNVSGVFQAWDDDDDTYVNDFYCAMTGDFIIRVAEGVTVERGDLLMSAGDGTAKPQDDDIIRSKTIAKVTSTNVSCTYDDGSYCVPCVLMAC